MRRILWQITIPAMLLFLLLGCLIMGGAETAEEAFDAALQRTGSARSGTAAIRITLRQNGEEKLSGDILCQMAQGKAYLSAGITGMNSLKRDMEVSINGRFCVIRDGNTYYALLVGEQGKAMPEAPAPELLTASGLRRLLRKLLGGAVEKMTVTEMGLSLHVPGREMPFMLGVLLGLSDGYVLTDAPAGGHWPKSLAPSGVLHGVRQGGAGTEAARGGPFKLALGYALQVDHVDLDMEVTDGRIGTVIIRIALGSRTSQEEPLLTELDVEVRLMDFDRTEPGMVDVWGVEMEVF